MRRLWLSRTGRSQGIRSALAVQVLLAMMVAVVLVPAVTQAQQPVELTMWFGRRDFIPADAFSAFHRANPHIRVKTDVIPLERAVAEFLRAAQAGRAPDLVQVPADSIGPLAIQRELMDARALIERWRSEDPTGYGYLSPAAWSLASWEGTPHGVALHLGPYWFAYRVDWFREAGIPHPPKTWDDVLAAGRRLRTPDRIGFSVLGSRAHDPVWFLSTFMSMGGKFRDAVPQLDSDAGVYLLRFYQALMRDRIANPETLAWDSGDMRAAFIGGKAAQILEGDNIFPRFNAAMPYLFEWAATTPPVRPGGEADARYMALGWPYLISARTKHPYEASLALRYLARPDIVGEVARRYQPTTVGPAMTDRAYMVAKPWTPDFIEPFKKLVPLPGHARQPQLYQVLLDAMQDALRNPTADARAMATRYQARLNEVAAGR